MAAERVDVDEGVAGHVQGLSATCSAQKPRIRKIMPAGLNSFGANLHDCHSGFAALLGALLGFLPGREFKLRCFQDHPEAMSGRGERFEKRPVQT